jgi:hypothetical protein
MTTYNDDCNDCPGPNEPGPATPRRSVNSVRHPSGIPVASGRAYQIPPLTCWPNCRRSISCP